MMRRRGWTTVRWLEGMSIWALAAALAAPAAGDWLVFTDGSRLETRGPWKVRKNLVLFTLPNGMLSSVRVVELDLAASALASSRASGGTGEAASEAVSEAEKDGQATVGANEPLAESALRSEAASPGRPGLDAEAAFESGAVPSGALGSRGGVAEPAARFVSSPGSAYPDAEGQGDLGRSPEVGGGLVVTRWQYALDAAARRVSVHGVLENRGRTEAVRVSLTVRLRGPGGAAVGDAEAILGRDRLAPGMEVGFWATVPGVVDFDGVEFELVREEVEFTPLASE